jgi:hypothetical protein
MVPYWFDEEFDAEHRAGRIVGAEDTGALLAKLIWLGASTTQQQAAASKFAGRPSNWNEDWMVGTLNVDEVSMISAFLSGAPLDRWAETYHVELATEANRLGYSRSFDEHWSAQVIRDAHKVSTLFSAAAAAENAVIVKISA